MLRVIAILSFFSMFLLATEKGALSQAGPASTPNVSRASFASAALSGSVEVDTVFRPGTEKYAWVFLSSKSPALLNCMDYSDFRFQLQNQSRSIVKVADSSKLSGAMIPVVVRIATESPGQPKHCPYGPGLDGKYRFALDALFPKLEPGTYKLLITLAPRRSEVSETKLPGVSFEVAP
jgi:hypothetical protein